MTVDVRPFHGRIPGMPDLFHTYCDEHPEFGTCASEEQAHVDVATHLSSVSHWGAAREG